MDRRIPESIILREPYARYANLESVTSYLYRGDEILPELDTDNTDWNEGTTWYPFATEESGKQFTPKTLEGAQSVADSQKASIALRCLYLEVTRQRHYRVHYFRPTE